MQQNKIKNFVQILKENRIEKISDHSVKVDEKTAFFSQKFGSTEGEKHILQAVSGGSPAILAISGRSKVTISNAFSKVSRLFGSENLTVQQALMEIHSPTSIENLQNAQFFLAGLEYIAYKNIVIQANKGTATVLKAENSPNYGLFNFELTQDQRQAVQKIVHFQENENGKLFLLQGDVGCGKTAVAILVALQAVSAGFQVAVLAPTQILAGQLYQTFNEALLKLNIKSVLLTSKEKTKEKRQKLAEIQNGDAKIVIGTHAVFSENVVYKNLGFVIIDEQHKFGVNQRLALIKKSQNAKCLLMTATPIPRTLAMSMYSGIEYLSIQEKPKNRLEIKTSIISEEKIPDIINSIKTKFKKDEKIYWVCPLVEEEVAAKTSIKMRHEFLLKYFKPEEIEIAHGKMKEEAINSAILNFKNNSQVKILLATTIVEVGIDIKNANVIIIESSENFGLASLHQLRGRVGRGVEQGFCILLYNSNRVSQIARERLEIMRSSTDGFIISQMDRKMRGNGNILGVNQSGAMKFVFFDEEQYFERIGQINEAFDQLSNLEKIQITQLFEAGFETENAEI